MVLFRNNCSLGELSHTARWYSNRTVTSTLIKQSYGFKLTDLLDCLDLFKLWLILAGNGLCGCRRNKMYLVVVIGVNFRE